jgi:hypothetical protein
VKKEMHGAHARALKAVAAAAKPRVHSENLHALLDWTRRKGIYGTEN